MKLAFAVLALLCISAHAHGIPQVEVTQTNEGIKSPQVTVKLPAVTVPLVPKVNLSIPTFNVPEVRLPKISLPGKPSVSVSAPSVDVQGLINAALNKPVPTFNVSNLAALFTKPAINLDLSGLLSKPAVNISALSSLFTKPSIDLSGLSALLAAKPGVSVSVPDASTIVSALLAKHNNDVAAVQNLLVTLAAKPNITIPQLPVPSLPSFDVNTLISLANALKGNKATTTADIAANVVSVLNYLVNKPVLPALNLTIPKPVFPSFNISTPSIDLSGLAAAAASLKPLPQIDLSGLATLALSKPIPSLNLTLPDITALTSLALNKPHVNLTVPAIEALISLAATKASLLPTNITLPEVTALLTLAKPNIDLSGLTALLAKPNVTLPDASAILSTVLAQHAAGVQALTSAATSVISALSAKPNVQLPDLSGLFAKPSFNLTGLSLPKFDVPTVDLSGVATQLSGLLAKPNVSIDLSGVANAILSKPATDLAALQSGLQALLAAKPSLNLNLPDVSALLAKPSVNIDLSGLSGLVNKTGVDLSALTALLDKNFTLTAPQLPTLQLPTVDLSTIPLAINVTKALVGDNLDPSTILALLNHAGLHAVSNSTLPTGQVVIDVSKATGAIDSAVSSALAAKQSAINSAVGAVNSVASSVQAAKQGAVNSAVDAVNGAVAAKKDAVKKAVSQVQKKP